MTHPRLKIFGSIVAAALGVALGWISLEWFLSAVESDDVRLVAAHLGEKLWMQAKFAGLSSLIGLSVLWGAIISKRWNVVFRIVGLGVFAVIVQFAVASVRWAQISAMAPDGTEDMPAMIYFGALDTEWIPFITAVAVWLAVVPLLFSGKHQPELINTGDFPTTENALDATDETLPEKEE
ncbi:MAG: hypothetical protein JXX29_22620 [Deltaproteobacteria bacterium]|nr:hypothetical protein [Deltaproteobacteria bacterium]MBN2674492.1 hypothetical protein [Deltaproteobacteria bacterium]